MLLFAVPIMVRSRLAKSAGVARTPSDAPRRSSHSHLGARSNPVGGWMIWLALMISAFWAAIAGLSGGAGAPWLLVGSIALAACGLIGLIAEWRGYQSAAITRPAAAPRTRRETRAIQTHARRRSH